MPHGTGGKKEEGTCGRGSPSAPHFPHAKRGNVPEEKEEQKWVSRSALGRKGEGKSAPDDRRRLGLTPHFSSARKKRGRGEKGEKEKFHKGEGRGGEREGKDTRLSPGSSPAIVEPFAE